MALTVRHATQVVRADDPSSDVGSNEWNADHTVTGTVDSGMLPPALTPYFMVDNYGAVGNGSTDDTSAINTAIQAAASNGGGIVFFGPKTYAMNGNNNMLSVDSSNIWLLGSGKGATVLKVLNSCSTDAIRFFAGGGLTNVGISDLTINMQSFSGHNAVFGQDIDKFFVRRVSVINALTTGIGAHGLTNFDISDNDVTRVTASGAAQNNGIILYDSLQNQNGTICRNRCLRMNMELDGANLLIANNRVTDWKYGGGIVMGPGTDDKTHDNIVSGNICTGGTGVDVDGTHVGGLELYTKRTLVTGNITSGNSGFGILLGGDSMTCTGNLSFDNGVTGDSAGIFLQDGGSQIGNNCVVTGNRCYGTQDYGIAANGSCVKYLIADNVLYGNNVADVDSNVAANSFSYHFGTSYTVLVSDRVLDFTNSGTITLTLPNPTTCPTRTLFIKSTGGGSMNSASSNVVPLAGGSAGTAILTGAGGHWVWLVSDGTSWIIMASNG